MDEHDSNAKRRRGPGVVTPNACTECRKKRSKCDGQNPCGRCASQTDVQCIYEVPVRTTKNNMRSEIEQLRASQRQSDRILAALVSSDTGQTVLQQLQSGESMAAINYKLEHAEASTANSSADTIFRGPTEREAIRGALQVARSIEGSPLSTLAFSDGQRSDSTPRLQFYGSTYQPWESRGQSSDTEHSKEHGQTQMAWDSEMQQESYHGPPYPLIGQRDPNSSSRSPLNSASSTRDHGQDILLGSKDTITQALNFAGRWTEVTNNGQFVDHVMALYFCWEYPTFASLNKEHFLEDFRNGVPRYCSSLLVNTILSLGCRFSNQPEARSDPNDSDTAGNHFFAEAVRLLNLEEDRHVLTTIQALGLMSLREASCGRSSESLFLSGQSIRLAIEIGMHKDTQNGSSREAEIDHEVRSATFWGAFSLDQAWSLSTGRLPQFSRDIQLANKPAIVDHVEASAWVPYTDDGVPLDRPCIQPSNVRSVFKSFCELSEIIHQSLYAFYTPGVELKSKTLLDIYSQYLHWYEGLTAVLRLGHNFTPAVLFAHMHYHFAILLLFRPFIKLGIIGSRVSPKDVCAQASDAISALVNSYKQLYTLRRTPSFVPYFVLTSSIAHMVTMSSSRAGPEQLRQGLEDLKAMAKCHMISTRALNILRFLIRHWEVSGLDEDEDAELEDIKTMCRPRSMSLNQFCPHVEGKDILNTLTDKENPLFWPFPLQGRPLLDTNKLEACGFVISEAWAGVEKMEVE